MTIASSPTRFNVPKHPEYQAAPDSLENDRDRRIAGVMPVVASIVYRVHRNLPPRKAAVVGVDDLFQAAWVQLIRKDDRFNPYRGPYPAFAKTVISHHFQDTIDVMRRLPPIDPEAGAPDTLIDETSPDPLAEAEHAETAQAARQMVAMATQSLGPETRSVICHSYGVDDARPLTNSELARLLLVPHQRISQIRRDGECQLRSILAGSEAV
jgi:RNA polymerase sigma factor (sigma-70 family)